MIPPLSLLHYCFFALCLRYVPSRRYYRRQDRRFGSTVRGWSPPETELPRRRRCPACRRVYLFSKELKPRPLLRSTVFNTQSAGFGGLLYRLSFWFILDAANKGLKGRFGGRAALYLRMPAQKTGTLPGAPPGAMPREPPRLVVIAPRQSPVRCAAPRSCC